MFFTFNVRKIAAIILLIIVLVTAVIFVRNALRNNETANLPVAKRTIVIDAGHGFPDGGAVSESGTAEKDINFDVAVRLCNLLEKTGAYVIMTRLDDNAVTDDLNAKIKEIKRNDLKNRKNIRNNSNADLFVSIHMNKFEQPQYFGAQVFYSNTPNESKELAECIQTELINLADPTNTRMVKKAEGIYILKDSPIPSVLVECGFLSNPEEAAKLETDKYRDTLAWAVYCGILKFFEN